MKRINQPRRSKWDRPTLTLVVLACAIILCQSNQTLAQQWGDNGANIYNTNSGNVGIGTTNPSQPLHVSGTDTTGAGVLAEVENTATTGQPTAGIVFRVGGVNKAYIGGTAFTNPYYGIVPGLGIGAGTATDSIFFRTGSSTTGTATGPQMIINPAGNVGIGLTTPSYKLDVAGQVRSGSGGFVFPDGTVQTTAATGGGSTGQWTGDPSSISYSGSVGIGTPTPQSKLQVGMLTSTATAAPDALSLGGTYSNSASQHLKLKLYDDGTYLYGLGVSVGQQDYFVPLSSSSHVFYAGASPLMTIKGTGQVGIGTTTPTAKLDVNGNLNVTGDISATGNIAAKYQDVAEWVEAAHALPAGTVVVLNPAKSNQVIASSTAYDTRVAGVVSAQPGLVLGVSAPDKVLVATTGRVKVKVDATRAAIHVGDLLVTSDKEGLAMKSVPLNLGGTQIHRPGTLIGKALEPLENDTGEILVLLSLQ